MTNDLDKSMAAMFTGNFLDATDLMSRGEITLEISDVCGPNVEKDSSGKIINKGIIAFKGAKKRLILNKTNATIIKLAYGEKASEWIGKKVTLCVRWLKEAFGHQNVPVIRIVPAEGTALSFGMRQRYGKETPWTK